MASGKYSINFQFEYKEEVALLKSWNKRSQQGNSKQRHIPTKQK